MLVELGAFDLERSSDGAIAAVMPDVVDPQRVAAELGSADFAVRAAVGRDDDSVWVLRPRPISVGRIRILPAAFDREPGAIRLIDSAASPKLSGQVVYFSYLPLNEAGRVQHVLERAKLEYDLACSVELWLQHLPGNRVTVQVRYAKTFRQAP